MPAKKTLDVSSSLKLPLETVTESIGILGQRGSGKSTTSVVLAEEMWDAGIPWVAVDPKGDWYGIRSSADGRKPGLALPVFGGLHGDVPLESSAGNLLADLIVGENLTAVLDVSDFSKAERARFLIDFFTRLFRLHRADPHPRHMFMEEAHSFIPQQVMRDDARLKEAAAKIVLEGRTFGLGSSACSQRSARLHKDVLTQIGTLIVHRNTAPQDIKAIEGWVKEHDVSRELIKSLPELNDGEAWIWSPHFLKMTKRLRFRRRETFDSGATPKLGKKRVPATIADVDLGAIKEQMSETIERAKESDPKELQRRVRQLEKELAAVQKEAVKVEVPVEVEVPVITDDDRKLVKEAMKAFSASAEDMMGAATKIINLYDVAVQEMSRKMPASLTGTPSPQSPRQPSRSSAPVRPPLPSMRRPAAEPDDGLDRAQRAILNVLAQYPHGRTKTQVALISGYSSTSGGFNNALSKLRTKGYITRGQPIQITQEGLDAMPETVEPLPSGEELVRYWMGKLPKAERVILETLYRAGRSMSKDEVGDATGYSPTSGGFNNALSRLRTLELIEGPSASMTVHPTLTE